MVFFFYLKESSVQEGKFWYIETIAGRLEKNFRRQAYWKRIKTHCIWLILPIA